MDVVLEYLTHNVKDAVLKYISENRNENIEEIRLRSGKKISVKVENKNLILDYRLGIDELLEIFQKICEHSIYTYQKEIGEGFITIKGGHRVGIAGNCVIEDGKVKNINYISSLNIRIAREKRNCSENIIKYIIQNNEIKNTLIVSKPGVGKTTMLRDCIRIISESGRTCGIVDERGEISAMYRGMPQNDVGPLSDVMCNVSKSQGMRMLIRSMSPDVIACDEIGSNEDVEAIKYAICSGVKGIFTAHGDSFEEIMLNQNLKDLYEKHLIEVIVFLDSIHKGKIREIYQ